MSNLRPRWIFLNILTPPCVAAEIIREDGSMLLSACMPADSLCIMHSCLYSFPPGCMRVPSEFLTNLSMFLMATHTDSCQRIRALSRRRLHLWVRRLVPAASKSQEIPAQTAFWRRAEICVTTAAVLMILLDRYLLSLPSVCSFLHSSTRSSSFLQEPWNADINVQEDCQIYMTVIMYTTYVPLSSSRRTRLFVSSIAHSQDEYILTRRHGFV